MNIEISSIEKVEKMLKIDMDVEFTSTHMKIICQNRCRLLSNLLHRSGLDIHCTNKGIFTIDLNKYSFVQILAGFEKISNNPVWIVEFVEKYVDNKFMMDSTFGSPTTGDSFMVVEVPSKQ